MPGPGFDERRPLQGAFTEEGNEMLAASETETVKIAEIPAKAGSKDLINALVPDFEAHPERSAATLARVEEVLGIVAGPTLRKEVLAMKCAEAAEGIGPYEAMPAFAGMRIAAILTEAMSGSEISAIAGLLADSELSTDEVVELHRKYKIPVSRLEEDLLPVRGKGALIYDSKGREYVDLDSNYSATNLGNSNPGLAQALFNQACRLVSQKEDRIQVARARFLKEFGGMLPEGLECFYWQNSGGEAVDKALKIAKACTRQTGVIAFEGGFHGRTHGAIAVTHNEAYRKPFGLDRTGWVHFAKYNDARSVKELLEAGKARIVILELVQGEESGIRPATKEFAAQLRDLCDTYGAVLIADEVQTGFGRVSTGPGKWFACQVAGITPDIMVIGKSFGGGYPVTAVVAKRRISEAMKPGYDGSTFGGNPMAMTAALVATRQMKALDIPSRAARASAVFREELLKIESSLIKGVRIAGLMIGIEMVSEAVVRDVQEIMKKHGAHSSLSSHATMRWMPPLIITDDEIGRVIRAFAKAVSDVETSLALAGRI